MSYDSNDELKLTKEYKYLLSCIRPLIDQLDKSRDAQLCLLWLSKLEQCGIWERVYRNQILSELCKQVKANYLKPPFNSAPPNGPLRCIISEESDWREQNWSVNEYSDGEASTDDPVSSSSQHTNLNSFKNSRKRLGSDSPWNGGHLYTKERSKGSMKPPKESIIHSECFAMQKAYQERAQSDQMVIERYQDIIKSLVSQQLKAEFLPSKMKKLQATYESKVTELMHSLKKAQEENDILKKKLESDFSNMNKIDDIKSQNESLSKQLLELESKKSLFEIKCKQIEEEKLITLSDLISKLSESSKKLKESEKRFKALENDFEENCRILKNQHLDEMNEREKKYLAQVSELEKLVGEKAMEINSLKEQISCQSSTFQLEMSKLKEIVEHPRFEKDKEKIKYLKNKTKKLEKVREHMAVLFQSQLQEILAKKDLYIATLEMQLKMNNSESGGSNLESNLDVALNEKVANLEAQYRKLLEDSERQSLKRRQLDLQKIHSLEKQLLLFGGVIEDIETNLNNLKTRSLTSVTASESEIKAAKLFNA